MFEYPQYELPSATLLDQPDRDALQLIKIMVTDATGLMARLSQGLSINSSAFTWHKFTWPNGETYWRSVTSFGTRSLEISGLRFDVVCYGTADGDTAAPRVQVLLVRDTESIQQYLVLVDSAVDSNPVLTMASQSQRNFSIRLGDLLKVRAMEITKALMARMSR